MNLLKYLLIFWLSFIQIYADYTLSKIEFIKSLCQHENRPTVIYSFVCWNLEHKKALIKSVSGLRTLQGILVGNVNTNNLFYPIPAHFALFVIDLQCNKSESLLKKANDLNLFGRPYRWVIFDTDLNAFYNTTNLDQDSLKILNTLQIYIDSDVIFLTCSKEGDSIQFEIFQPYKITKDIPIINEYYGQWTNNFALIDKRSTPIISRRRKNLHQVNLRVGLVINDNRSLAELGSYKTPHIDTLTKSHYVMSQVLYEYLNCSPEYIIADTLGGPVYLHSVPKGLFKIVMEKNADIGAGFLMNPVRLGVKFLSPSSIIKGTVIFRQPRLSYVENLFTLTFASRTWLAVAILTLVALIILTIAMYIEDKYKLYSKSRVFAHINYLQSKISDLILVVVASICQQGTEAEPRSNAGKIILFMLLISLMFLYNAYTANIVVILQSSSSNIRTVIDLANSKLNFACETVYFGSYFDNITIPDRLYLAKRKIYNLPREETFITINEGINRVRNEPFAFATLPTIAYHLVEKYFFEHEKCDIQEIPFVDGGYGWIITPHNSVYIENLKVIYQTFHEMGHTMRVWKRFYLKKPFCANKQNYFTSAGIEDLNFAFKLFSVGVAVSVAIFLFEHLRYRLNKDSKLTYNGPNIS